MLLFLLYCEVVEWFVFGPRGRYFRPWSCSGDLSRCGQVAWSLRASV